MPVHEITPPQVDPLHPRGGVPIVLTAPLTETIDHAGYLIQMSMTSLPIWLEGILNRKYPPWRHVACGAVSLVFQVSDRRQS